MIKSIHEEEIKEFKQIVLESTKSFMEEDGELVPVIQVLVRKEESLKVVVIPVSEFVKDDNTKDVLAAFVPFLFEKISKEEGTILCFSFSFEAWVRKLDKKEYDDNWKNIPISHESLMSIFETEYSSEHVSRIIERVDGKVKILDASLDEINGYKNAEGRFVNLFRKYHTNNLN